MSEAVQTSSFCDLNALWCGQKRLAVDLVSAPQLKLRKGRNYLTQGYSRWQGRWYVRLEN